MKIVVLLIVLCLGAFALSGSVIFYNACHATCDRLIRVSSEDPAKVLATTSLVRPVPDSGISSGTVNVKTAELYLAWVEVEGYKEYTFIATYDVQTLALKNLTSRLPIAVIDVQYDNSLGKLFGLVDPGLDNGLPYVVLINPLSGRHSFITATVYLPKGILMTYESFYDPVESKYYIEADTDKKNCIFAVLDGTDNSMSSLPLPCSVFNINQKNLMLYDAGGWSAMLGGPVGFSTRDWKNRHSIKTEVVSSVSIKEGTMTQIVNMTAIQGLNDLYTPATLVVPLNSTHESLWITTTPDPRHPYQSAIAIIVYDASSNEIGAPELVPIAYWEPDYFVYSPI
jgi:hypothetical protein